MDNSAMFITKLSATEVHVVYEYEMFCTG